LQRPLPQLWGELGEPAGWCGRTPTGDLDDDVHAAAVGDLLDHRVGALDGRDVRGDEAARGQVLGSVPGCRRYVCPGTLQTRRDGRAEPAGAAADERALPVRPSFGIAGAAVTGR
jgi:hypothetical protein